MTTFEGRIDQWIHRINAGIRAVAMSAVLLTPGCVAEIESTDDPGDVGEAQQADSSPIYLKYISLQSTMPDLGVPSTGELVYSDGVGKYQNFKNAAGTVNDAYTIVYHPSTGAHLIYGLIRAKWRALGSNLSPNGYPKTDEATTGSGAGRFNNFQQGTIIWKAGDPAAYSLYGAIYNKWGASGWDSGFLGFPLNDETSTPGNTGRYNDFDNGAIYHRYATGQTFFIRSPVLEPWQRASRTQGTYGFPIQDTLPTADPKRFTQAFQGGGLDCSIVSQTAVQSDTVHSRVLANSRSVRFDFDSSLSPNTYMDYDLALTDLTTSLKIRTAMVVFTGSYTRTFTAAELSHISDHYLTYAMKQAEYSHGLSKVSRKLITVNATLPESEFNNYRPPCGPNGQCATGETCQSGGCAGPGIFRAEFNSYGRVLAALSDNNVSAADFDVIHIVFPWQNTVLGGVSHVRSGRAWANPVAKINPASTWTTVYEMDSADSSVNNDATWTLFLHEAQHTIEFTLGNEGYSTASPDDPFWLDAYPDGLTGASSLVPQPVSYSGVDTAAALYGIVTYGKWRWSPLANYYGVQQNNTSATLLAYSVPIVPGVANGSVLVQRSIKVH